MCPELALEDRGGARAKAFFKRRCMDNFLSGCKNGYFPWESEGVSNTARDIFCDEENLDLLQLHRLMSSIFKIDYAANNSDLTKRENMLRGHILENSVLQNSDRKDPITMMLV